MGEKTCLASGIFEDSVAWLQEHYYEREFWVERDVVWTVQTHLRQVIADHDLPWMVLNDYPMLPGPRRSLSADLVVRDVDGEVLVAVEFKYEPSHERIELQATPGKLPVVSWGMEGVAKDVVRIREFVEAGKACVAYAMFIDEGRHFRHRTPHPRSEWRDWGPKQPGSGSPSILWARWPASTMP
jgi:hypothetical protein